MKPIKMNMLTMEIVSVAAPPLPSMDGDAIKLDLYAEDAVRIVYAFVVLTAFAVLWAAGARFGYG